MAFGGGEEVLFLDLIVCPLTVTSVVSAAHLLARGEHEVTSSRWTDLPLTL